MTNRFAISLLFMTALTFLFVRPVLAHGTAQSFPKEVGDFRVEMEYDDPEIFDNVTTPFVFRLLDKKTDNPVKFDALLIRFEKKSDQSTYIVARVTEDELQDGVGRLSTMLNQGDYTITAGFYKAGNKVAEVNYDIKVVPDPSNKQFPVVPVAAGAGGVVAGFILSRILVMGKKKE